MWRPEYWLAYTGTRLASRRRGVLAAPRVLHSILLVVLVVRSISTA